MSTMASSANLSVSDSCEGSIGDAVAYGSMYESEGSFQVIDKKQTLLVPQRYTTTHHNEVQSATQLARLITRVRPKLTQVGLNAWGHDSSEVDSAGQNVASLNQPPARRCLSGEGASWYNFTLMSLHIKLELIERPQVKQACNLAHATSARFTWLPRRWKRPTVQKRFRLD